MPDYRTLCFFLLALKPLENNLFRKKVNQKTFLKKKALATTLLEKALTENFS
jgi:hypothetical protein